MPMPRNRSFDQAPLGCILCKRFGWFSASGVVSEGVFQLFLPKASKRILCTFTVPPRVSSRPRRFGRHALQLLELGSRMDEAEAQLRAAQALREDYNPSAFSQRESSGGGQNRQEPWRSKTGAQQNLAGEVVALEDHFIEIY